jgi:hypothetical protein
MISKYVVSQSEERRILPRSCIGNCTRPPACVEVFGIIRFQDLFTPSACKFVNIPDATIRYNIIIDARCNSDTIINEYVIPQCERPCTASVSQNMFTIFLEVFGNTDVIQLDPNGCCNISRILWEAAFGHIPITQENDPNWRRLCFIENDQFPAFIAVPPLNIYNWIFNSDIITFEYASREAYIAALSNPNCFTYIELQPIRFIFPDTNALICEEYRREKIDTVWGGALCICIGQSIEEERPDPFNLKEDYEILSSLTIGADLWEIQKDIDTLTKIIISRSI